MAQLIEVSNETYQRFMALVNLMSLVNPQVGSDHVMKALLDRAMIADSNQGYLRAEGAMSTAPPGSQRRIDAVGQPASRSESSPDSAKRDVVRRTVTKRAKRGSATDRRVYMRYILAELARMKGRGRVGQIKDALLSRLEPILTAIDRELIGESPIEPRWWNHVRFARQWLVDHDYLRGDTGHGVWELSERGWTEARKLVHNIQDPAVTFDLSGAKP